MKRIRIYVDMDDTMFDYKGALVSARKRVPTQHFPQAQMDFFRKLEPIDGAIQSVKSLAEHYDVWILSRPSHLNPLSYTEKRLCIEDHLGIEWCNRLILCPDKSLMRGDFLIDDVPWPDFEGTQILFGGDPAVKQKSENLIDRLLRFPYRKRTYDKIDWRYIMEVWFSSAQRKF